MPLDRELKVIFFLGGTIAVVLAGTLTAAFHEESGNAAIQDAISAQKDGKAFTLEGAHAVTADYEGRRYTFNFDNRTVMAGRTQHVGFGGAGYGGLVSFENMNNDAAIAEALAQGCAIAGRAATQPNPGWPVTDKFSDTQKKAAQFAAAYCP